MGKTSKSSNEHPPQQKTQNYKMTPIEAEKDENDIKVRQTYFERYRDADMKKKRVTLNLQSERNTF